MLTPVSSTGQALPEAIVPLLNPFAPMFQARTWAKVQVLLSLLVQHLDQSDGPLVFGIDETLERRRGRRIRAKGVYRDGMRSSGSHFVKASGLRWISLMWLTTIPWAHRTWALPVLTALAPSERYYHSMGRTHKRLTGWARSDDPPATSLAAQPTHRGGR